jgi:hypothetical protein
MCGTESKSNLRRTFPFLHPKELVKDLAISENSNLMKLANSHSFPISIFETGGFEKASGVWTMTTSSPSLRVLCLHDNSSSATKLYLKLHLLDKRLYKNHGIELIYVNSPLRGVEGRPCDDEGNKSSTTTTATDQNRHVWWEEELSNDNTTQYVGLDASLLHLRQIYNTMPFQGILAEGAGAAIASLFLLSSSITPELEFGVFLNGTTLLRDENERLIADWPCLHVVGEYQSSPMYVCCSFACRSTLKHLSCLPADSCPSDDTDMLIRQFGGQVRHLDGDSVTKDDLNALGKVCKATLLTDSSVRPGVVHISLMLLFSAHLVSGGTKESSLQFAFSDQQ